MAKGTKIITFRLPGGLEEDMEMYIESRNEATRNEPWTKTAFIIAAIREKIDHGIRSRRARRRKKNQPIILDESLSSVGD